MTDYAVHLTTTTHLDPDDDTAWGALLEALAPLSPALGAADGRLTAQLHVPGTDLYDAARSGARLLGVALCAAGVPLTRAEVVAVEVMTLAEFDRRVDTPDPDSDVDLMATADVAERLGVSRQRVAQLAAEHPEFPASVRLGARGLFYPRPAVERFADLTRSAGQPGRTRATPPTDDTAATA